MFHIKMNLTTKLDNVNDSKLWDKYKLKVYTDFLLHQFTLTVYDIQLQRHA